MVLDGVIKVIIHSNHFPILDISDCVIDVVKLWQLRALMPIVALCLVVDLPFE